MSDTQPSTTPLAPADFVAQCVACIADGGTAQAIAQLTRRALASQQAQPQLWSGRELLHRSDDLFIVDLTLQPFATSAIHDHGTWAVIGVSQGCEVEDFYVRDGERLVLARSERIEAGNALVLEVDAIHAIANPSREPVRGLHVYGRDLFTMPRRMWDPETVREQPMELGRFEAWEQMLTARSAAAGRTVRPRCSP